MLKIKIMIGVLFIVNVFGQKFCSENSILYNKCEEFSNYYATSVDTSCTCSNNGIPTCNDAGNNCDNTQSEICKDFCKRNGYSCVIEDCSDSNGECQKSECETY